MQVTACITFASVIGLLDGAGTYMPPRLLVGTRRYIYATAAYTAPVQIITPRMT